MSSAPFDLPETQVPKDVIERVQFSVSSRNAGSKVSECLTHVFVSPYAENPTAVNWQYVSSGVTCLLRKKEVGKSGRKLVWTVHLCLYNVTYGVLVWKGSIAANSCYTAVTDSFHVFVMHELNAIVGLLFNESSQAKEFLRAYLQWDADKTKEEKGRGGGGSSSPSLFRKEMISKPCNFQHIQGTQALDECMEIERIKTDIQATFFGLGSVTARRNLEARVSGGGKRKKDVGRPRLQLQNISIPHKASRSSSRHPPVENTKSLDVDVGIGRAQSTAQRQESVPAGIGVRLSMPPPLSLMHHQSHPDLLENHNHGSGIPTPPQPMSPQSSIVPNGNENGMEETSLDRPQTVPTELQYDVLPTKNGGSPVSPVSPIVQNQSTSDHVAPTSPIYDGLVKVESPLYDSLQKDNRAEKTSEVNQQYQPQLFVDTIVEEEVAGYTKISGESGGLKTSQEYTPPPRLSPLSFEKEFSNSPFFHPAFVTSTTNC